MTSEQPDLAPEGLLPLLQSGKAPRELRQAAARGALPIENLNPVRPLYALRNESDSQIRLTLEQTLRALPIQVVLDVLQEKDSTGELPFFLARSFLDRNEVLEAITLDSETPDYVIDYLASRVDDRLLDLICINQERLIRAPAIMKSVLINDRITPDIRRRVLEIQKQFVLTADRAAFADQPPGVPTHLAVNVAALKSQAQQHAEAVLNEEDDESHRSAARPGYLLNPSQFTLAERIHLAIHGSREERRVLIQEPVREVYDAVLRSGKTNERDVEGYCRMKSVSTEALRAIGNSREWVRRYPIVINLIRNPKTPPELSLRLMTRARDFDLKAIQVSREVPEAVRRSARRMLQSRQQVSIGDKKRF